MIKPHCFLVAEYAGISTDGKLTIAGTFDSMMVVRPPDAPPDAPFAVVVPHAYIVVVSEASLADGLSHQLRLRILDGNGQPVVEDTRGEITFALNAFGRPMRNNLIINLMGRVLPGPDDYVFELSVEGHQPPLAEFVFAVTEAAGQPNG